MFLCFLRFFAAKIPGDSRPCNLHSGTLTFPQFAADTFTTGDIHMAIKVAFIGAGSVGFTRRLFRDILAVPELQDTHFAFTDISGRNLDMVTQLCQKDIANNRLPARITATTDRRRAVAGADYVINCTRVGGLEAFALDIDIPLKYGVDQCVGDTLCIGGVMYGQRNIACILDFCRDIRAVAKPGALFLNYANPMAMNTWAALGHGGVNTVGLCHGVEGGWRQIANVLARLHGDEAELRGDDMVAWDRKHSHHKLVDIICAGINHQTWYVKILYKGREVGSEELLEAFENHPTYRQTEKVRIDMLRRFGYYTTESNGHVSEYVPWYRKRPAEIRKWIDLSSWINGETGGYLRVCTEGRNWFATDFPKWLAEAGNPITRDERSSEHGSYIIEAIETGRVYRGHFNRRNNGIITNLPEDAIIEAPGYVDKFGIHLTPVGDLPLACAATCISSINVQRMSVEAAVRGDVVLLKQAVLHDPLTAAVCNPEEIWQMVDEMLVAQTKWLPQYRANGEIARAKRRLDAVKRNATYRGTRNGKGAARIKVKSIAELRRDKEASVLAADKAAAQRAKDAKN
jgi:alpha-galactosidase